MPEGYGPTAQTIIHVGGRPVPDSVSSALVSAVVEDGIDMPAIFTLTFADPTRSVIEEGGFEFGRAVRVLVTTPLSPAGASLVTNAEITALEAEVGSFGMMTIVRGLDKSHRLHRTSRTEVYRQVSYPDVARRVASRAGIPTGKIDGGTPVLPYVLQSNETDWEFLRRCGREIGYEVYIVGGKLEFRAATGRKPGSGSAVKLGPDDLLHMRNVVTGAQQVKEVKTRGWNVATKQALISTASVTAPRASSGVTASSLASTLGGDTAWSVDVPYATQAETDAAAKALAYSIGETARVVEGTSFGNDKLRAGGTIVIEHLGSPFDGRFTLAATTHIVDEDGYTTNFVTGGRDSGSLLGLPMAEGSAPNRMGGVAPAIVTDVRDPEKRCRVKVQFPWLSDKNETDWIRVAQPWAGNGYGSILLPEVNDEVLVAFEMADVRRPYVVGGLYNGKDKPKDGDVAHLDSTSGRVAVRRFVSRAGHALTFVDREGKEAVELRTGDGKCVLKFNCLTGEASVVATGPVKIKATQAMTLESDMSVEIKAPQVKVTAAAQCQVTGAQVEVAGSAMTTVKSGGIVNVQGTLVKIN